jgi:hypothetical protein
MGSTTSRIATRKAAAHFMAGPLALIIAFIGNLLVNLIYKTPSLTQVGMSAIIIGGIALFVINMLIAALYTVPSAVEEKCGSSATLTPMQRFLYGLWPAFFSVIGDPNIVAMLTYATPLIILAPIITSLLPPGPLTIGLSMLARNWLTNVPVIGTIINFFPLTKLFDQITSSWIFLTFMFLIGFNFWSWVGGSIAATQAMNNICPNTPNTP